MSFRTLSTILRGQWLIDKQWAESQLPLVLSLLNGNPVSFTERTGNEQIERPFAIDPTTMRRYELSNAANVPPGSVGVLPISGAITKYNGDCGEPGAIRKMTDLVEMERRDNISSVILLLDTPGGEARAANAIISTIGKMKKPVLAYVDGMAASLGVYITAAADEVYLSSKTDQVGSVGSYVMLADFKGYFESQGLKIHEIYAPQSTDKNKDYRDALKGDYSAIEQDLEAHVNEFINYVSSRKPRAAEHQSAWNSGKMFYGNNAVKVGLADGIRSWEQVVSKAAWNAKMKKK